jgi:hypothetical protein
MEVGQGLYQGSDTNSGFMGISLGLVNQDNNAFRVLQKYALTETYSSTVIPIGCATDGNKIFCKIFAVNVTRYASNGDFLAGVWSHGRYQNVFFGQRKPSLRLLNFKLGDFLICIRKLLLQTFYIRLALCLRTLIFALGITGLLCFASYNQIVFAQPIPKGDYFRSAEQEKTHHSEPKPEMCPCTGVFDRIPAGPPCHDYSPLWLCAVATAFLVGFKIAARMSKRQTERLKRIWMGNH